MRRMPDIADLVRRKLNAKDNFRDPKPQPEPPPVEDSFAGIGQALQGKGLATVPGLPQPKDEWWDRAIAFDQAQNEALEQLEADRQQREADQRQASQATTDAAELLRREITKPRHVALNSQAILDAAAGNTSASRFARDSIADVITHALTNPIDGRNE